MEKKNIVLRNGEAISYLEEGTSENVLILLHGNLSSSINFEPLIKLLSKDFRVIAPDLRGSGDSTYYRKISKIADLSEDLVFFMNALNIKNSSVLGWALGGAVGMSFASKYWDRINKLILLNSVPHSGIVRYKKNAKGNEIFGAIYENPNELASDPVLITPLINAFKNKDHEFVIEVMNSNTHSINTLVYSSNEKMINDVLKQRNYLETSWSLANFNMSHQHNFYSPGTNSINNIHCPVLHIWGEEDLVIPEYMVLQNLYALKDISSYTKYEKCGHNPMIDQPDRLALDIKEFLLKTE